MVAPWLQLTIDFRVAVVRPVMTTLRRRSRRITGVVLRSYKLADGRATPHARRQSVFPCNLVGLFYVATMAAVTSRGCRLLMRGVRAWPPAAPRRARRVDGHWLLGVNASLVSVRPSSAEPTDKRGVARREKVTFNCVTICRFRQHQHNRPNSRAVKLVTPAAEYWATLFTVG